MDTIEVVTRRKWIAFYTFLILDFLQILLVSVLYLDELNNPFIVGIDFTRFDPGASLTLLVGISLLQLFLVYYMAIAMQRSPDLLRLYPDYESPDEWVCQYSRNEIVEWTHETAKMSGVTVNRIYLMKSPLPNAFTFSLPFMGSIIAVHSNILDVLQPEEVKAIVAHEVGHIKNRDSIIQILARMPAFFIDTIYIYVYVRIALGISNALFVYGDVMLAGIRVLVLLAFFGLSRFLAAVSAFLMQKASREAELLSDYHAAEIIGAEQTINGLIRLGQRTEAVSVLIGEIQWLESLNPERSGAVTKKELIRMIEQYPLDGIDEANAREMAPWVFLATRLKHMREVYGVDLSDQQIKAAIKPAMDFLEDKRPEKEEQPQEEEDQTPKTIDWRSVDYDGDRRLSNDELRDLLELLRTNPKKLMFDSEVGKNLMALSHPDFRRRVLTIADSFGL
ncbi:MAG: M48 family metallopeptidase [Candidatus Thorarchaeota archaeon]